MQPLREQLMTRLMTAKGYVSGAEVSQDLGISREAVWKHIRALRREGFVISASPRKGYLLLNVPDVLHPWAVVPLFTGGFGRPYHYHGVLSSTNDRAKELAHAGASEGTVVVTEEQTGGRGRRGRLWHSPRGGLWFSLILRPGVSPAGIHSLSLLVSLAVVQGVNDFLRICSELKWPNDIFLGGRKAGGVLIEIGAEAEQVHYAVAGVGLNVNITSFPAELDAAATSLRIHTGKETCRARLLGAILKTLEDGYSRWCREGFGPFREEYKKRLCCLGKEVTVSDAGRLTGGVILDVEVDGRLVLGLPDGGTLRLSGGEVTVREGRGDDPGA
ncbi:MAG: biotin--[acetyl-CoA-carboxylase] ligase [Bacillota bacterium]